MRIRHRHGFTNPPNTWIEAEIEPTRSALATYIQVVFPLLRVDPRLLTFTSGPGDGWRQVNVHGFGPFGDVRK